MDSIFDRAARMTMLYVIDNRRDFAGVAVTGKRIYDA